ncbi:MAG: hypothetical protein II934_10175 [Prevotella sp.]|nr:hypothetical protein [Prevotella sp.]
MTETIDFHPTGDTAFDHLMQDCNAEIQMTNDLILPDEMVASAIERACKFFHLPEVPFVDSEGTCVWPKDAGTPFDDVFGFNRRELMTLGIQGEDSLTLVYTHECAHRALQSYQNLDVWEHELACDFFAGIHAAMAGIDTENFEDALGATKGSDSHPAGTLRADFIEYGKEIAKEMELRKVPITFEGCLERFNAHLIEEGETIAQCRQAANNLIPPKEDEEHPLGFVNDKAWNEKQARDNFDNANWHRTEAQKATERGDYSSAKDHMSRANSYDSKGKDYMDSASKCTK